MICGLRTCTHEVRKHRNDWIYLQLSYTIVFRLFSVALLPMDTSMDRVWVTRGCIIPPRQEKRILPARTFVPKRFRAAYVTSRGSCIFFNRDSIGILSAKRYWTLGATSSPWHQDINVSTFELRSVFWQNKGHWQITGLRGRG